MSTDMFSAAGLTWERLSASTPLDQLGADIEAEERAKSTVAFREPISLQARVQQNTAPTLFYSVADSLRSYLSEIQYMFGWEMLTRAPDSRFGQGLEQIKYACPLDPFDREAVLAPLEDLMEVFEKSLRMGGQRMVEDENTAVPYLKEVGSRQWWHVKIAQYYDCLDRINYL